MLNRTEYLSKGMLVNIEKSLIVVDYPDKLILDSILSAMTETDKPARFW